ncbi:NCS2 family permease [Candidatus Omnitrophota bacterium]
MRMMLEKVFALKKAGTNVRTEVIAGLTTFMTMAYIIVVNPKILQAAGIPFGPSMVATIISAFFGTLIMGLYAKRPFAIAPYMGENAFIAFTVVKVLGYSWQTALGAIFIGGVLFIILTALRLRQWMAYAIPESLKYAFAVGIGLFLTFIGLNESGIVKLGVPGAPVKVGDITSVSVMLAIFCFLLIGSFMIKKIKGSILLGILITTFLAFLLKVTPVPKEWISMPPSIAPIFLKLDILGALTWGFFAVILTVFVMDFVDTIGTLIGVSARAGLLDKDGNLPEIEKPMMADAVATVIASLLGTTTTGTYIESAAGIEEGGRTGLTACVTAVLFLLALFFAPFLTAVPPEAYGPALIVVGLFMFKPITKIKFDDYTEMIPAFGTIILMSFTYNLGIGITAGFVLYAVLKTVSGRYREIHPAMWVLSGLSALFFVFYPY